MSDTTRISWLMIVMSLIVIASAIKFKTYGSGRWLIVAAFGVNLALAIWRLFNP